jgi:hypothetical protein
MVATGRQLTKAATQEPPAMDRTLSQLQAEMTELEAELGRLFDRTDVAAGKRGELMDRLRLLKAKADALR